MYHSIIHVIHRHFLVEYEYDRVDQKYKIPDCSVLLSTMGKMPGGSAHPESVSIIHHMLRPGCILPMVLKAVNATPKFCSGGTP